MKKLSFIFLINLLLLSCYDSSLNKALKIAQKNREELEKVLILYKNDPEKLYAAKYLIANMPYHYSYEGLLLDNYMEQYELYSQNKHTAEEVFDLMQIKYGTFSFNELKIKRDINEIDSAFLVNNIDFAFYVWRNYPWGKNVSFDNFCRYVLPYRIGNEKLTLWRDTVFNEYIHLLDNIIHTPEAEDPLFIAQTILDSISKPPVYFTMALANTPHVGPDVLKWRSGSCRELSAIPIYILRSMGIPVGIDLITLRSNHNNSHFWNFVLDKDGKTYYTEFPDSNLKPATDFPDPKAKVYRQTFDLNITLIESLHKISKEIHPTFQVPKFIDVTDSYAGKYNMTLTFHIKDLYNKEAKHQLIYLCLSSIDNWIPVTWGIVKGDSIYFENIEGDGMFQLATYQDGSLIMQSSPFYVDKVSGEKRFIKTENSVETIKLLSKFPLFEIFIPRMVGGILEGSNNPDFINADTLHIITDTPGRLYTEVYLNTNKKYRYYRYKGPEGGYCNIAEFILYEKSTDKEPLSGRIIGTPNQKGIKSNNDYLNAIDGNPYTSFDYIEASGGWVGLDVGFPCKIDKFVYVPRNRDNFIRTGDKYELFYWNKNRWNSLGIKIADADSLVYTVPKGSLLYLRNHTRGDHERIFEYIDNKQEFR